MEDDLKSMSHCSFEPYKWDARSATLSASPGRAKLEGVWGGLAAIQIVSTGSREMAHRHSTVSKRWNPEMHTHVFNGSPTAEIAAYASHTRIDCRGQEHFPWHIGIAERGKTMEHQCFFLSWYTSLEPACSGSRLRRAGCTTHREGQKFLNEAFVV